MKTNRLLTSFFILLFPVFFISCIKTSNQSAGTTRMEVRLTDDPGTYDAVLIDVEKVEVNASSDTGAQSGWQEIAVPHPGIYNLLDFRNGIDTLLAAGDLPAGMIQQMRMILGNDNSVVINGVSYPLTTPSAQESGLKFNIHATLTAGIVYRLWIDFDAARSIVSAGNSGKLLLKPVIRTYTEAIGGSIKGFVLPEVAGPLAFAIQGADTLSTVPDSTGYYFFGGVDAGIWSIWLHPSDSTYHDTTLTVTVSDGTVTDAGTITLHQ